MHFKKGVILNIHKEQLQINLAEDEHLDGGKGGKGDQGYEQAINRRETLRKLSIWEYSFAHDDKNLKGSYKIPYHPKEMGMVVKFDNIVDKDAGHRKHSHSAEDSS